MKKIFYSLILISSYSVLFSQSKKDIKKNKITSVAVTESHDGKSITDSKTIYDASGEIIEKTEYTKEGLLKKTIKYKLNNLGDVVSEEEYDERNILKEKTEIKYNALGDKKEELVYDASNKLIKKNLYVYDAKGLKIERKTVDISGRTIADKKYTYTFK